MDERVRRRLFETSSDLSLYSIPVPSKVDEAFSFNPTDDMDATDSKTLSQYTIMLGQYLITLQVRFNTARVLASQTKKVLDRQIAEALKNGQVKGSTLQERRANAILESSTLQELEADYDEAAAERDLLDGIDKPIVELINALKSELRRRMDERQYTARERF